MDDPVVGRCGRVVLVLVGGISYAGLARAELWSGLSRTTMSEPESGQAGRAVANLEPSRDDPAQPAEESGSGVERACAERRRDDRAHQAAHRRHGHRRQVPDRRGHRARRDGGRPRRDSRPPQGAGRPQVPERAAPTRRPTTSTSRFRREAQVSAKLRNEHITRVIDVGDVAREDPVHGHGPPRRRRPPPHPQAVPERAALPVASPSTTSSRSARGSPRPTRTASCTAISSRRTSS